METANRKWFRRKQNYQVPFRFEKKHWWKDPCGRTARYQWCSCAARSARYNQGISGFSHILEVAVVWLTVLVKACCVRKVNLASRASFIVQLAFGDVWFSVKVSGEVPRRNAFWCSHNASGFCSCLRCAGLSTAACEVWGSVEPVKKREFLPDPFALFHGGFIQPCLESPANVCIGILNWPEVDRDYPHVSFNAERRGSEGLHHWRDIKRSLVILEINEA